MGHVSEATTDIAQGRGGRSSRTDANPGAPVEEYQLFEQVWYWSKSQNKWVAAVVHELGPNDKAYNLNIKRGARAENMRKKDSDTPPARLAVVVDDGVTPAHNSAIARNPGQGVAPTPANPAQRGSNQMSVSEFRDKRHLPPPATGQEEGITGMPGAWSGPGPSQAPAGAENGVLSPGEAQGKQIMESCPPKLSQQAQAPKSSPRENIKGYNIGTQLPLPTNSTARSGSPSGSEDGLPPRGPSSSSQFQFPYMGTGLENADLSSRSRNSQGAIGGFTPAAASRCQSTRTIAAPLVESLEHLELEFTGDFKPELEPLRSTLLPQIGCTQHAEVQEMKGFAGGLNLGVWYVSDPMYEQEFVLKLVRGHRIASGVPTEVENLRRLAVQHPEMLNDEVLSFPFKVFDCISPELKLDLIVMRKVPGQRLAEIIATKCAFCQMDKLMPIFRRIGQVLAQFHTRYHNLQHGDFQPSNIFVDEGTDDVIFIDVGGIGVPTVDDDRQHFFKAMRILADNYGPQFEREGRAYFDEGYELGRRQPS